MIALTLSSVIAAFAVFTQDDADPSGVYIAGPEGAACRIMLAEPATRPPESRMEASTVSGLALVHPGCGLALADAALWRLEHDERGRALALFDQAGGLLWAGLGEEDGWRGPDANDREIVLRPAR